MREELKVAIGAARAGGDVCRKYFGKSANVRYKKAHDLVSDADLEAEEVIVNYIKTRYPDHHFLGEETYRDSLAQPHAWCIDPVDGTNNFAHRVPHFAVSIGYYENGVPQAGAVFNPMSDELFYAEKGKGAFLNEDRISVSPVPTLKEALAVTGFYYDRGEMMEATLRAIRELLLKDVHGIRRMGAASLDLCYVACGRFDLYFEYALQPWDFAGGALIVTEAGGTVTTGLGAALPLVKASMLATNSVLHPVALEIIARLHPTADI